MGARRTGARSTVYGEKGTTRWTAATESGNANNPLGLTPVRCSDDVHHSVSNLDSDPVVGTSFGSNSGHAAQPNTSVPNDMQRKAMGLNELIAQLKAAEPQL